MLLALVVPWWVVVVVERATGENTVGREGAVWDMCYRAVSAGMG